MYMYKYRSNCLKFQTRDIKVCHFNECVLSSNYIICRHVYKLVERSGGKGGGGSGVQSFFFNLLTSLLIVNSYLFLLERNRERERVRERERE